MLKLNREKALAVPGAHPSGREIRMPCPVHGADDPDARDSLCIRENDEGRALVHCHAGCAFVLVVDALKEMDVLDENDRRRNGRYRRPGWLQDVFDEAASLWNSPAETYLEERGLQRAADLEIDELRWHERRRRMVAAVRNPKTGELEGLHTTCVETRERKSHGRVNGNAVRLMPATNILAVAEGIETALAFAMDHKVPTWAALSANGMAAMRIPDGTTSLVAAADFDGAGLKAAEDLLRRAKRQGVPNRVLMLPGGQDVRRWYARDWLDVHNDHRNPED